MLRSTKQWSKDIQKTQTLLQKAGVRPTLFRPPAGISTPRLNTIPEKSFQLVRYYGWYSNRMRGERKKLEEVSCAEKQEKETVDISKLTMIDVADYKPRRIPPPLWRECTPRALASRAYKESVGG